MRRRTFLSLSAKLASLYSLRSFATESVSHDIVNANVVIVGSGPAGLVVSDYLTQAGISVAIIESGDYLQNSKTQQLGHTITDSDEIGYDPGHATQRRVGGTTSIWAAQCPRMRQTDLRTHSLFGYGQDWPLNYEELARHYCEAARWLDVGESDDIKDSTCTLELNASSKEKIDDIKKIFQKMNIVQVHEASVGTTPGGQYIPTRLLRTKAPILFKRKNIATLLNTTARRLILDNKNNITAVECMDSNHKLHRVSGSIFIVACGGIQTPRLLMLSRNNRFPTGLGNQGGHLGRWFMEHPSVKIRLTAHQNIRTTSSQSLHARCWHWYETFRKAGVNAMSLLVHIYPDNKKLKHNMLLDALCEQEPSENNYLYLHDTKKDEFGDAYPVLKYSLSERDRKTVIKTTSVLTELLNHFGSDYQPIIQETKSHHIMGTTRMADSVENGVVDNNLKVFGVRNLYLAGSSVFPTSTAANPTLTLTALAIRLSKYIISMIHSR